MKKKNIKVKTNMKQKIFSLLALLMTAVTASAIEVPTYSLNKAQGADAHGTIQFYVVESDNLVEVSSAAEGQTVTVTIKPDEGWYGEPVGEWYAAIAAARNRTSSTTDIEMLKDITFASAGTNTWTFIMQRANAEISATYRKLLTNTDITIEDLADMTYTGKALKPAVTVTDGSTPLVLGTDYTVSYSNNVNAGKATVTITGIGNYAGTVKKSFAIINAEGKVVFSPWSITKTYGDPNFTHTPIVTGTGTLTYSSNNESIATVDASTGEVTIKAVGKVWITAAFVGSNYTDASDAYLITVEPKEVAATMIGEIAQQTYTGGPLTPEVTVTDGDATLAEETDYTVAYSDNTDPGQATVTITGMGNYTGTASTTFTILSTVPSDTDDEAVISISATGKSTFVSTRDVDFTNSNAEAYIAIGYNATEKLLTLSRIYKVPAKTPVLVKGKQGVYNVPFTTGATYQYKDLLVGNTTGKTIEIGETSGDDDEFINHVLKDGEFKSVDTYAYVPKGKAHLTLPASYPATKPGNDLSITLPASGKSTLCYTADLDFSGVKNMNAYAATGYDPVTKKVMLSRVLKASAGTPLVLHGKSNTTYSVPSAAVQTFYLNMLVGNTSGAAIKIYPTSEDGTMVNHYLSSGEFKSVNEYATIPDGKCYLQLPGDAATNATRGISDDYEYELNDEILLIRLDGTEATGIDGLLKAAAEQDVYYNLNGQRTENPRKGIYVQRGRKVVIK